MDNNEIKKVFYRQNTDAYFRFIRKGVAYYDATTDDRDEIAMFEIPASDMGDADFHPIMKAKHLVRWMVTLNQPTKQ